MLYQVGIAAAASSVLLFWADSASSFTPTTTTTTTTRSLHLHQPTSSSSLSSQLHHLHHGRTASSFNAMPPHGENIDGDDEQQLHLLTFDLDDTIFPIGPVVADANVAQLQTLIKFGYEHACNKQIIAASKQIRTELREAGDAITYTDLRKQSVRREIERLVVGSSNNNNNAMEEKMVHDSVIEAIFDAWLNERHASADRNLYPHASNALQCIKDQYPNVIIGAITNGRGNPLEMPSVASYFDFCVSGEDEGVFPNRKPDKGIYRAAIGKFNEIVTMQQQRQQLEREEGKEKRPSTAAVEMDSLNWIHVGDDLANDVGASAACGAKTIWFTMEEGEDGPAELPSWSTATKEELQRRAAMDDMAKEFVSAKIGSLEDLPGAVFAVLRQ